MNSQKSIYNVNALIPKNHSLNQNIQNINNINQPNNITDVIPDDQFNINLNNKLNASNSNLNSDIKLLNNKRKRYITKKNNDNLLETNNNMISNPNINKPQFFEKNKPLNINQAESDINNTNQEKCVFNNLNQVRLAYMSHIELKNSLFNNSIVQVLPFKITNQTDNNKK